MNETPSSPGRIDFSIETLPFETEALRAALAAFLDTPILDSHTGGTRKLGSFKWGVYAFFDYDGEPIYVGQTYERLSSRIRRHLTNRRTDAVAMSVLDPFEVCEIEVWPLPQFEQQIKSNANARAHLNALEHEVYQSCIERSRFKAVLNEKLPPEPAVAITLPTSHRGTVVTPEVAALRDHPDLRIARRAAVAARLAQIIAERKVAKGLRRALLTQTRRLQWLAEERFSHIADTSPDIDELD